MSKVVDIKQYKLAKVRIKEFSALVKDYEYILKAISSIQVGLNKWGKYQGPLIAAYKLEESKLFLQHEVLRLSSLIKLEKSIIDG